MQKSKKKVVKNKIVLSGGSGAGSSGSTSGQRGQTASPQPMGLYQIIRDDITMGSRRIGQCFTPQYIADKNGVSPSTVYNYLRQYYRDGDVIYKTVRGLVEAKDVTSVDQMKVENRLAKRHMGAKIEAGAVCPHIITTWRNTQRPDRAFIINVAEQLMANPNGNAWTGIVSQLYNIIDVDDPRNNI